MNVRNALIRTLAVSLIKEKKIKTTVTKAKVLRPFVERLITHAKHDTVSSKRLLRQRLGSEKFVGEVSKQAKSYSSRNGGYTRIVKAGIRKSDGAEMAIIEFV